MDFEVDTNISKEYKSIKVLITAPELNEQVQSILNNLSTVYENRKLFIYKDCPMDNILR